MDFWARRVDNMLVADNDESIAEFVKLPFGKSLHVTVKQPRNGAHHRLFWTLVHRIADGIGADPDNVADVLKIETGHFTAVKSKTHGILKLPRSISFAKMDQTQFAEFFEKAVHAVYENWGIDPSAVADLLAPQSAHIQDRIKQVGK